MGALQNSSFVHIERRALVLVLRQQAHWSLADVLSYIDEQGDHARVLGQITLLELAEGSSCVQRSRRARATSSEGQPFDALMLQTLREVYPREVGAAYLDAQVGGPRWKRRASLSRLEQRGLVTRAGTTSNTTYRAVC